MSSSPPLQTTAPSVSAPGPAPAGPLVSPPSPSAVTPMVTTPGPATVVPPTDTAPAYAPTSLQVAGPSAGDRYGVGVPARRGSWGEGSTLVRRDARVGVYIGPTFKLTGFGGAPGLLLGADFGVLLGERFAIGAAGSALVTPLAVHRSDGRTLNMRTQHAGVTLRVALVRVKFFTLGIGALIGGGRACLNDERLDRCVNRAAMFVAEPELGLTFAVTRVLRLVLSGGYRVAVAQAWSGPSDRQLGGLTGTLGFQLGKF
ncbi:MAG: hypothetical protein H0T76_07200 [Nannocystis sp.]|nr:hypothetical protein [Nannocystis sp.]MBA3546250.1 hypothetical protein [Nannocystis sp.]